MNNTNDAEIDSVYDLVLDALADKQFDLVNSILSRLTVEHQKSSILLAYLATTFGYSRYLPARKEFLNKCRTILISRGEDVRVIDGLDWCEKNHRDGDTVPLEEFLGKSASDEGSIPSGNVNSETGGHARQ